MDETAFAHATHEPVSFTRVTIDDEFWSPRQALMARTSLPLQLSHLEANGQVDNFRIAAGVARGAHRGMVYYDSDLFKWIEAASIACHVCPDKALEREVDRIVDIIIKAQQPDGYINTFFTLVAPGERMKWFFALHELYCGGHLIEAGVSRTRTTGRDDLLRAGMAFAGFVIGWLDARPGTRIVPGHPEIELALYRLFQATGDGRYATLARDLLMARGTDKRVGKTALANGKALLRLTREHDRLSRVGTPLTWEAAPASIIHKLRFAWSTLTGRYSQQHAPVLEQREPTGHAVRATYMYCAMADWYITSGDPRVLDALDAIWTRMVERRMHVTGGLGPLPMIEGWGRDHELPDDSAYCETCAAIGNVLWNWRMFLATGQARYLDVMELALYNAMLGGWSLDGRSFTYANPLAGPEVRRHQWFACPCCPPNVGRIIMSLGGMVSARDKKDGIAIVQFTGARVQTGETTVAMQSGFPWTGSVAIALSGTMPASVSFRVPSWTSGASVSVDGVPVPTIAMQGSMVQVSGDALHPGSTVSIDIPMEPRFIHPAPEDKNHRGHLAVRRGPLIYCAEAVDNDGQDPRHLAIDVSTPVIEKEMVIGNQRVVALQAGGVVLVPFFARGNRARGPFATWMKNAGGRT